MQEATAHRSLTRRPACAACRPVLAGRAEPTPRRTKAEWRWDVRSTEPPGHQAVVWHHTLTCKQWSVPNRPRLLLRHPNQLTCRSSGDGRDTAFDRCVGVNVAERVTTMRCSNVRVAAIVAFLAKGPRST